MNMEKLLTFDHVLKESKKDDRDKKDIYCKMGEVTFLARDIREFDVEDEEEGEKKKATLHAQISVPDPSGQGRVKLNFCLNSFKQFVQNQLGIPHQYLMKCPSRLAKDQVSYWMSTIADNDLLIRARIGRKDGEDYARAVLSGSYGRMDNTELLNIAAIIADEANMRVFRFDMPDHSMHIKALLNDNVDMGSKQTPDPVHLGFHIGNSETGNRTITWDVMTFRLVCTNGLVTLVDGARLVSQQHRGDIDLPAFRDEIRTQCHKVILKQDAIFGKMGSMREAKLIDPFEEARAVWAKYGLPSKHRNHVFTLLTEKYTDATRWDVINAITECAQSLADNPDIRLKMEEAAGRYMQLDKPLLIGVGA
jgi:hypothetical protein